MSMPMYLSMLDEHFLWPALLTLACQVQSICTSVYPSFRNGSLYLHKLETGELVGKQARCHSCDIQDVDIANDVILTGSRDQSAKVNIIPVSDAVAVVVCRLQAWSCVVYMCGHVSFTGVVVRVYRCGRMSFTGGVVCRLQVWSYVEHSAESLRHLYTVPLPDRVWSVSVEPTARYVCQ